MNGQNDFYLKRHRRAILVILVLVVSFLSVAACEFLLREFMGLGNPILYDSSPIYGYRPLPNREYKRFWGANVKFNNIGLRTNRDWDEEKKDKILFLGDSVTYGGSYIDNKDLFSGLAVELLNKDGQQKYTSGNAGVNAWGVENIYGLIMEAHFLPAGIYVTTLPEDDFYRGITRIHGQPFFNNKPKLALQELWYFFCYRQNNNRYKEWTTFANKQEQAYIIEKAVKKLKAMDSFLRENGCKHFVFITPSKSQVMEGAGKDMAVYNLLTQYELAPHYIADEIAKCDLSDKDKEDLFHDGCHLKKKGHQLWAKIIAAELKKVDVPQ